MQLAHSGNGPEALKKAVFCLHKEVYGACFQHQKLNTLSFNPYPAKKELNALANTKKE